VSEPETMSISTFAVCWVCAVPLCVAAVVLPACSSSSSGPPVLGDCVAKSGCAASSSGGGSGPPGGGDGGTTSDDGGGPIVDASSCGTAGGLLNTQNSQCQVCISTSCCLAASACTGQCLSLVTCPSGSIASCESSYPQGVTAYNDFGACIAQSCSTQCPALPVATAGDI
jgi:hypothetical protein